MKRIAILASLITYHLSLITASAAVPLRWTVETSRVQPATFEAYQGETLSFEAALQSYGKPLAAPSEYAIYWQTNGMGNAWWSRPCVTTAPSPSAATNVLFATWSPDMDVGAKVYSCFIGLSNSIYRAAFQLRLRPSPGALPNALPLPTPVIDFSQVTVLNPPWSGVVDTNAVREIAADVAAPMTNELAKTRLPSWLTASTEEPRGKTDLDVYEMLFSQFSWTSNDDDLLVALENKQPSFGGGYWFPPAASPYQPLDPQEVEDDATVIRFVYVLLDGDVEIKRSQATATRTKSVTPSSSAKLAHTSATSGIAKLGPAGELEAATPSSTGGAGADYRDPQDNICHKDSALWVASGSYFPQGDTQPLWNNIDQIWFWSMGTATYWADSDDGRDAIELEFHGDHYGFTAKKISVATAGRTYVTDDVVDGKVSSAVSTNNPAFVSAVRNTPTSGMPEDIPTDWGTYGTVGAALAALAAFVKWAKAKIVAVIGDDGKPTDTFAADILSNQAANAKVRYALATASSETMVDRTVNLLTMTADETLAFPTATTHDGKTYARDFLLKLAYTAGTMTLPTGVTKVGDELSFTAGKTYLLAFTEIASNQFYVRSIEIA